METACASSLDLTNTPGLCPGMPYTSEAQQVGCLAAVREPRGIWGSSDPLQGLVHAMQVLYSTRHPQPHIILKTMGLFFKGGAPCQYWRM